MRILKSRVIVIFLTCFQSPIASLKCDAGCSGHGKCNLNNGRCECFADFLGVTCAEYKCPKGIAWSDYPIATDIAHQLAECSNMGICNRQTGICKCVVGFEGVACERMKCASCTNGRCISMREAAKINDGVNFFTSTTYNLWDADKIYGCQCDLGWTGYKCTLRECPKGDDPMTTGQLDEIQQINCLCDGCTGSFALTFRRRTTINLLPTDTAATLQNALSDLETIHGVSVTLSGGSTTLCDAGGVTTSITFTHNSGNLPPLQVSNQLRGGAVVLTLTEGGATGLYDSVGQTIDGTKEEKYCSNRGTCNFSTGLCTCQTGFSSSNGAGAPGNLGDCGYGSTTSCPLTTNGICNGKGTCTGAGVNYVCLCNSGYTGYDCTLRTCGTGIAWFDGATDVNTAHALAECSNKGVCDSNTGLCTCDILFTGSTCELLTCPGGLATPCMNSGTCKTMAELATTAASNGENLGFTYGETVNHIPTWDANKITGCVCNERYYMGPYSGAIGDFHQYDCSARFCPMGPDPLEVNKVNEQQSISCLADGGSFTLSFRQATSQPIAWDATALELKQALESLSTIVSVQVSVANSAAVCGPIGVLTTVEFTTEFGELPLLSKDISLLTLSASTAAITISQTVAGTKSNLECSGRGTCDRNTGVCSCFPSFFSSDGNGHPGIRGDCGHRSIYSTVAVE